LDSPIISWCGKLAQGSNEDFKLYNLRYEDIGV